MQIDGTVEPEFTDNEQVQNDGNLTREEIFYQMVGPFLAFKEAMKLVNETRVDKE